jgi:hypothetical protein
LDSEGFGLFFCTVFRFVGFRLFLSVFGFFKFRVFRDYFKRVTSRNLF